MNNKIKQLGKIKVIAGNLKNSNVFFTEQIGLRPSLNRHRERLFSWLNDSINHCVVLDLFAGSGILGIEALSRSAKKAVLVEKNTQTCQVITENLKRLKITNAEVINQNALVWLNQNKQKFDLIFLDPPFENLNHNFEKTLAYQSIKLIAEKNALNPAGFIYLEIPETQKLDLVLEQIKKLDETQEIYKVKQFKSLTMVLFQRQN